MKNIKIVTICLILVSIIQTIVIVSLMSKKEKIVDIPPAIEKKSCLIQYNSCHFIKDSLEPWENSCQSVNKEFIVEEVGENSLLLKDNKLEYRMSISKNLVKEKINENENPKERASFLYLTKCTETASGDLEKVKETKIEEVKTNAEVKNLQDIVDKCIVLKNNCKPERWDEDKNYCHEFKNVYKVLEIGNEKIRAVTWNGHGKKSTIGTEEIIDITEYQRLGYETVDCFDLMKKYGNNFNPTKGR